MKRLFAILPITLAWAITASAQQTPASPSPSTSTEPALVPLGRSVPAAEAVEAPENDAAANSVRIVRLSLAQGSVTMDRHTGLGFEPAVANFPIVQGAQLQTKEGSAEVEFEDGSTLRMTPKTLVEFRQLGRTADGATLSTMQVSAGTVYVSLAKTKSNSFALTSGDGRVVPRPGSHLRMEVGNPETRVSVITGKADFTNTAGSREIGKMRSLIFNISTQAPADLIAGIEDAPFDNWDEQQGEFHQQYGRKNALLGAGWAYGQSDLNYYGTYANLDGCGRVWRPYFVSALWDPFGNGLWAWYPGAGYSWVSAYPWAWTPYHYGAWTQCAGGQWGWQPGGTWRGLRNVHQPGHPGQWRHGHDPTRVHPYPPRPTPGPGTVNSLLAVNQQPLVVAHANATRTSFEFNRNSAGLGVPRGDLGKLDRFSRDAERKGTAQVRVWPTDTPSTALQAGATQGLGGTHRPGSDDRPGYFHRPTSSQQGPQDASRGSVAVDARHGTGAGSDGSHATAGYTGGVRNGGSYASGGAAAGAGYSGGARGGNAGGASYAGGGGGYSGGSRGGNAGGGSYAGGGGGYSGGSHSAPAPSALSAPTVSATPPSAAAPSASAPTMHK